MSIADCYKGKSIFVTGHTGFKGAWLCRVLRRAGASVTGYALAPEPGGAFDALGAEDDGGSHIGDIRDFAALQAAFDAARPEIVFHLAAQPLVLEAYARPAYTFETNIQGTVNLLECARQNKAVRSVVVVTTDKVYRNNEWFYGYRENDALGGDEPYSASKACAETVSEAYAAAFLRPRGVALSTARAGNVIGGGDVSKNRIIPDCVRAAARGGPVTVRNPRSVRPWQHVLEPLFAYLLVAWKQYGNPSLAGCYNVGPGEADCVATAELADIFCSEWGGGLARVVAENPDAPHESGLLKLDCSKMRAAFHWRPVWDVREAVRKTVEWEKSEDKRRTADRQIGEYAEEFEKWME